MSMYEYVYVYAFINPLHISHQWLACMYEYVYMYECICLNNYWFMSIYVWVCTYKYVSIYISMHVMLCYHWVTNHCGCCYYNEQDDRTALMYAADNGHGAIVTYLVEQGANKDLQDDVSLFLPRMIMLLMMIIKMMMIL